MLFGGSLSELRKPGYEERGGLFNVDRLGYVTINTFISKVLCADPQRQREILGGKDAVRKARAVTVSNAQGFRCSGESR